MLTDKGGSGDSWGTSVLTQLHLRPAKISGTLQFSTKSRQKEISNNHKQLRIRFTSGYVGLEETAHK